MLRGGSTRSQIAAAFGLSVEEVYARLANPTLADPPDANAGLATRVDALEESPASMHFAGPYQWYKQYNPGALVSHEGALWVLRGRDPIPDSTYPGLPTDIIMTDGYPAAYTLPGGSSRLTIDATMDPIPNEGGDPTPGRIFTFETTPDADGGQVTLNLEVVVDPADEALVKGTLWNDLGGLVSDDTILNGNYGIQDVPRRWFYGLQFEPGASVAAPVSVDFTLQAGADPLADPLIAGSAWQKLEL